MSFWEAIRKALYLARRSRFDHELEQELRFHFETRVRELEEIGMKPVGLEGGDSGMQWLQAGWCSPGLTEVMALSPSWEGGSHNHGAILTS